VRLIVARCDVTYSGRLNAFLPESARFLMLEEDGSVLRPRGRRRLQAAQLSDAHASGRREGAQE